MLKKLVEVNKKDKEGNFHEENQYINLIEDVINDNNIVVGRNGNVLTTIGAVMHFDLTNDTIPIFTTKKLHGKLVPKNYFGL